MEVDAKVSTKTATIPITVSVLTSLKSEEESQAGISTFT